MVPIDSYDVCGISGMVPIDSYDVCGMSGMVPIDSYDVCGISGMVPIDSTCVHIRHGAYRQCMCVVYQAWCL